MLEILFSAFLGFACGFITCALLSSYKHGRIVNASKGQKVRVHRSNGAIETYTLAASWHPEDEYAILETNVGNKSVTFAVKSNKISIA